MINTKNLHQNKCCAFYILHRKREERLRKALQARERVEQMEEEKKKRMEQKFSQLDERNDKVKNGLTTDCLHDCLHILTVVF